LKILLLSLISDKEDLFMDESIARFVAETCRVGTGLRIRRREIYEAYIRWCAAEKVEKRNNWEFCATMRELGFNDIRISATGGTGFGWGGIALWDTPKNWVEEMRRFFNDRCFFDNAAKVDRAELFQAYLAWCNNASLDPRNQRELGTELRRLHPEVRKTSFSRGTGVIYPGYYGVGLRNRSLKLG
jgi:phage/plasmid-associated DNA primase